MHTHSKSLPLVYPPGSITGFDIEKHEVQLMFGDPKKGADGWMEFDPQDQDIIVGLFTEVSLLRKILRELMRREGFQITSANEFHRNVTSMAHKMHEEPEIIKELLTPYIKELFEQMFNPPGNGHGQNPKRNRPRRQRTGRGH